MGPAEESPSRPRIVSALLFITILQREGTVEEHWKSLPLSINSQKILLQNKSLINCHVKKNSLSIVKIQISGQRGYYMTNRV